MLAEDFIERKRSEINNEIKIRDIKRTGHRKYIKEAITLLKSENLQHKVFSLERLRLFDQTSDLAYNVDTVGEVQYRIGYYIVGQIGNKNNKWTWGQYTPMISKNDFEKLIDLAKQEGTYIL